MRFPESKRNQDQGQNLLEGAKWNSRRRLAIVAIVMAIQTVADSKSGYRPGLEKRYSELLQ